MLYFGGDVAVILYTPTSRAVYLSKKSPLVFFLNVSYASYLSVECYEMREAFYK